MKNVALTAVALPAYFKKENQFDRIKSVNYGCELCESLVNLMHKEGAKCEPVRPHPKFFGGIFSLEMEGKRFCISIGTERISETTARVTVLADPQITFLSAAYPPIDQLWMRQNKKVWEEFGRHFKNAVESQFKDCPIKWLTEQEWLAEMSEEPA